MRIKENIKISIFFTALTISTMLILWRYSTLKDYFYIPAFLFTIALLSSFIPALGYWIYKKGTKTGKFLGKYISIISLFVIYILAVLPTGILMKITKRDRLRLNKPNLKSYWVECETQHSEYENQF